MHNNSSHLDAKIAIIIVAAGRGQRAGEGIPKQYRKIDGQMVLTKTIAALANFGDITIVYHPDDKDLLHKVVANIEPPENMTDTFIQNVVGGASRTESVRAGLAALKDTNPDIVLIHDAARPFVSKTVITDVVNKLSEYQAVVPALPIVDALKTLDGNAVDRDALMRVQTPQGFRYNDIIAAYDKLPANASFADDIAVAHEAGLTIGFSKGDTQNIKLTYEEDFMQMRNMISIMASGYDVHQICKGDTLMLCGVEINAGFSLKGHSDADVGLHALTDALLGAIASGDIGDHFPPSDLKWKGASSDQFLAHAKSLVENQGGIIDHVDITLICEKPKVKPYREAMRETVANILGLPLARVSIKATTTEGLGFTGRSEGIAAQATASIRVPDAN